MSQVQRNKAYARPALAHTTQYCFSQYDYDRSGGALSTHTRSARLGVSPGLAFGFDLRCVSPGCTWPLTSNVGANPKFPTQRARATHAKGLLATRKV
jgi:hypothetical protein